MFDNIGDYFTHSFYTSLLSVGYFPKSLLLLTLDRIDQRMYVSTCIGVGHDDKMRTPHKQK